LVPQRKGSKYIDEFFKAAEFDQRSNGAFLGTARRGAEAKGEDALKENEKTVRVQSREKSI